MKRFLKLTLSSVCLPLAFCAAARAQVSVSADPSVKVFEKAGAIPFYDEAEDETGVYIFPIWLMPSGGESAAMLGLAVGAAAPVQGVRFTVFFKYPGTAYVAPRQVTLRVASTKRGGRRFSDGDSLAVNADGESLPVGATALSSREYKADIPKRGADYVDESLDAALPVEDLNRLAAAKRVEVKVGGESWKLGGSQLKALRRLAAAIAGAK